MTIGILALQGGYAAHARMLESLGSTWKYVRKIDDLKDCKALIIPGGESSTALRLLDYGFFAAIQELGQQGFPMFGTCAGAILLAKKVLSPAQDSLGVADVTVERNAYGRQVASRIVMGETTLKEEPMELFFIRAPRFTYLAPGVKPLVKYQDEVVCVQDKNCLLASFHPELTEDTTLHRYFLNMISENNLTSKYDFG